MLLNTSMIIKHEAIDKEPLIRSISYMKSISIKINKVNLPLSTPRSQIGGIRCIARHQLKCDHTRWRREGKWRGNWRMEWVASTFHTTSEHGVSIITYLLTPWCRVLLEQLTVLQLVKKFPHFTELEGSLPHSQAYATCLYPGPAQSSPYSHIPHPGDPS